jgi:hypothetical protein
MTFVERGVRDGGNADVQRGLFVGRHPARNCCSEEFGHLQVMRMLLFVPTTQFLSENG